jgi:hypothetical protein
MGSMSQPPQELFYTRRLVFSDNYSCGPQF